MLSLITYKNLKNNNGKIGPNNIFLNNYSINKSP